MDIGHYEYDWVCFKTYVEKKVENRCDLTNKNWLKLREYHMDRFLKNHRSPFEFLFKVKCFHPDKYRSIHCIPLFFGKYKELHFARFKRETDEFE